MPSDAVMRICFVAPFADVRIGRIPFGPINNIQQTFEHPQVSKGAPYKQRGAEGVDYTDWGEIILGRCTPSDR